jgi:ribonuclease Z
MKKITYLGTASAVPDQFHQNTHLLIQSDSKVVLVDCPGNPFVRLDQIDIDPNIITDLILTHFHPDHVSGLPLLLIDMWLTERGEPLSVHGLPEVLEKCKKMMSLFEWEDWEGFFPINFQPISEHGVSKLINSEDITIEAAPVCHLIPSIGIKIIFEEGSICYSGDTAPCDAVIQLAKGCEILIHESTGDMNGHTSPSEAGKIAEAAGIQNLFLIHYPIGQDVQKMIAEASAQFSGEVIVAEDLMEIKIS